MKRDTAPPCQTSMNTGMAFSIFSEIAQLLRLLDEKNQPESINLRGLPMTDADRMQLEEMLGRGEITAHLDLAGKTTVRETGYPGVWWIRHMGAGDRVSSEEITVARIPEILVTHPVSPGSVNRHGRARDQQHAQNYT